MTAEQVHGLLRDACPWLPADTEPHQVHGVSGGPNTPAAVLCSVDHAETERRHQMGLGAVLRLDWLDTLMTLPYGLPVPPEALTPAQRRQVSRMPAGCVDHTADGFVRRLARPLNVDLAVVTDRRFRLGLERAGRFAPHCSRVLVMPGEPADVRQAAIEADFWGIGLVTNAARTPRLVVAPQPFVRHRHTPAGWGFLELVHQQITERRTDADEAA